MSVRTFDFSFQRKDGLLAELEKIEAALALCPDLVKAQEEDWKRAKGATVGMPEAGADESKRESQVSLATTKAAARAAATANAAVCPVRERL